MVDFSGGKVGKKHFPVKGNEYITALPHWNLKWCADAEKRNLS